MERACRRAVIIVKRLNTAKGGAMLKVVIILMALMIVVSFTLQIFVILSAANTINVTVQESVLSVAAGNMPKLYKSLREGNTSLLSDNLSGGADEILSEAELIEKLCESLGLNQSVDGSLYKAAGSDRYYTIRDISVTLDNSFSRDREKTLTFITELVLEVPVAPFWNFGSISIPMTIYSKYTSKF